MGKINKVKIGGVIYDIVKTNKVLKDEEEDVADGVMVKYLFQIKSVKIIIPTSYYTKFFMALYITLA